MHLVFLHANLYDEERSIYRLAMSDFCVLTEESCLKEQVWLTYVVVNVNFMLYPSDKKRLHVGSRSPSLGYCFDCKAAAHHCVKPEPSLLS